MLYLAVQYSDQTFWIQQDIQLLVRMVAVENLAFDYELIRQTKHFESDS